MRNYKRPVTAVYVRFSEKHLGKRERERDMERKRKRERQNARYRKREKHRGSLSRPAAPDKPAVHSPALQPAPGWGDSVVHPPVEPSHLALITSSLHQNREWGEIISTALDDTASTYPVGQLPCPSSPPVVWSRRLLCDRNVSKQLWQKAEGRSWTAYSSALHNHAGFSVDIKTLN